MKKLFPVLLLVKDYYKYFIQSIMVSILLLFITAPIPYLNKLLIDKVYPTSGYSLLHFIIIAIAVVTIFNAFVSFLSSYFMAHVGARMSVDLKYTFYEKIQKLKFSFFDEHKIGEISSRFSDLGASVDGAISIVNTIIISTLSIIIFTPILFFLDWKLSLLSLATLPIELALMLYSSKKLKEKNRIAKEKNSEHIAVSFEILNGIKTIKSLVLEKYFLKRSRDTMIDARDASLNATFLGQIFDIIFTHIGLLSSSLYMLFGWYYILQKEITLGSFMAFGSYIGYIKTPLKSFIGIISKYQNTMVSVDRFYEYYNQPEETSGQIEMNISAPIILFDQVSFGYNTTTMVLKEVNLEINKGEKIIIHGPSGCGKTTLAQLLTRFYEPTMGNIFINGINIEDWRLGSLRNQIIYNGQEPFLFKGTLMDNVFFDPDNKHALTSIYRTIKICCADDFIEKLNGGLYSEVYEKGQNFSQGQKQRITLIRVLLKSPKVLILDESTSAIDISTEERILKNLVYGYPDMTIIFITHRITNDTTFDKVYEIHNHCLKQKIMSGKPIINKIEIPNERFLK